MKSKYKNIILLFLGMSLLTCGKSFAENVDLRNLIIEVNSYTKSLRKVRSVMGGSPAIKYRYSFSNLGDRAIYLLSNNLYKKTELLIIEQVGVRGDAVSIDYSGNLLKKSITLIKGSNILLDTFFKKHQIEKGKLYYKPLEKLNRISLLATLFQLNRIVNSLLIRKFSPRHVYQEIAKSTVIINGILKTKTDSRGIELPKINKKATIQEILKALLEVQKALRSISKTLRIKITTINMRDPNIFKNLDMGDLYDFCNFLLGEFKYLGFVTGVNKTFPIEPHNRRKYPSQLHQRAIYLHRLLVELNQVIKD